MAPTFSTEEWPSLNCAECDALDKALNDGVSTKNMEIHTVEINSGTKTIRDKARYSNCLTTTDRSKVISE